MGETGGPSDLGSLPGGHRNEDVLVVETHDPALLYQHQDRVSIEAGSYCDWCSAKNRGISSTARWYRSSPRWSARRSATGCTSDRPHVLSNGQEVAGWPKGATCDGPRTARRRRVTCGAAQRLRKPAVRASASSFVPRRYPFRPRRSLLRTFALPLRPRRYPIHTRRYPIHGFAHRNPRNH